MIRDILRFNRQASDDLEKNCLGENSLGDYLKEGKYSQPFMDYYLIPMGAAIWSTPLLKMLDFPAKSFIQFFHNHGLLALKDRPHWKTVSGGSHSYIKKFISEFKGRIETQSQIEGITRKDHATQIFFHGGEKKEFDKIVIATHADQALKLLKDPSSEEQRLLEAWTYSLNETLLHWDESVMPRNKKVWASWNYRIEKESSAEQPVSLTYHMNRLQNLKTKRQYFVTLNRNIPIDESKVIRKIYYTHPNYTLKSMATQGELDKLNDANRTLFCGSYFGYGFHEDAVKAALQAVAHLGVKL
jgi:predicted NAD/FAD-binding protein